MTAGTEVVGDDVVSKVEIEEKCVDGLETSDLNAVAAVDDNVGGKGNGNVGGAGMDDTDESSYVFVSGSTVVTAGHPGDTRGANVDAVVPISDSADEVDQFMDENLGVEKQVLPVDSQPLETNDIDIGSPAVSDPDIKAVKKEVNLDNGSAADPSVVLEHNDTALDVNGDLAKSPEGEEQVTKSADEVDVADGVTKVMPNMDNIVSVVTFEPECILNPMEIDQETVFQSDFKQADESESQVTATQFESTPDLINTTAESLFTPDPVGNTDCEVLGHDAPVSGSTVVDKAECQVTANDSGKPSAEFECQVRADGTESFGTPITGHVHQMSIDGSEVIGKSIVYPVSVNSLESGNNHTEQVDSTMTVIESDTKLEDHQELLVMSSKANVEDEPNNVCSGIEAEQQTVSVLGSGTKSEEVVNGAGTESEENLDPGLVQSEDLDAPVSGVVEKFDGTMEIGETQISHTEADEDVSIVFNVEKEKLEEKQVKGSSETVIIAMDSLGLEADFEKIKEGVQVEDEVPECQIVVLEKVQHGLNLENVEGSSETTVKVAESAGLEANLEETKEDVKIDDEVPVSQVVLDKVQDVLNLENNTAESVIEADTPIATETSLPVTKQDAASEHEGSSCIDGTQEGFRPEGNAENAEIVLSTDSVTLECKNGELVAEDSHSHSNPDDFAVVEPHVEFVGHSVAENGFVGGVDCEIGTENADIPDDEIIEIEVKDAAFGDHSTSSFQDTHVSLGTVIEFGSIGRHETIPDTHNDVIDLPDVVNGETKSVCGANGDNGTHGDADNDEKPCIEVEDMDGVQSDEIHTSLDGSVSDAPDVQNEEADVLPYNFLIRIPRFDDETIRDQIRNAQLQVDEKTRLRDEIRVEIHDRRARLKVHNEAFRAARLAETAARRLVRVKRQEIDTVEAIINRMKNAITVEDIDGRIYNMEHMIQHETMPLKDEKHFIREIKQLKTLRDQLAPNIGDRDEVRQALEQKDQIEESMKMLRNELHSLKADVSKAEAAVIDVGKTYEKESKNERALQVEFKAADDVRQKAYAHLNSLKKQLYDKNQNFRLYKNDVMAARDFASCGDKDGLHRLCSNQVEAFMEQWNNNDDFRNDYVNRLNMNNANRKRRTSDGTPDHVLPVVPGNVNEEVEKVHASIPIEVKPVSMVLDDKQGDMSSSVAIKHEDNDNKSVENVSEKKDQILKTKDLAEVNLGSEIVTVVDKDTTIDDIKEEQNTAAKAEIELARKAEELREEEDAAKLKEQRRLEEKAKAAEALERKKRAAEKAQLRAEIRARKEAEQKEKEREKRLRKKEKKKANGEGSINGDDVASSESSNEATTKEPENNNIQKKKPQKAARHSFSKQMKKKPVPPPASIRNRKRWQQWARMAVAAVAMVVILALFLLGNAGLFLNLRVSKVNGSF